MATNPLRPRLNSRERATLAALRADRLGESEERQSGIFDGLQPLDSGLTSPKDLASLLDPTDATPEEFLENLKKFSSDIQIDWNAMRLQDIPTALGEGVQATLDTLNSVIEVLKELVSLIRAGLELFAVVVSVGIDLIKAAYEAAILALEAVIDVFYSTSGSVMQIVPENAREARSVNRTLGLVANSYDNELNPERPISRSSSDIHVFVMFLGVAQNLEVLKRQIKSLMSLFNPDEVLKIFDRPAVGAFDYPDFKNGSLPNQAYYWEGRRLTDIKPFREFVLAIKGIINNLTLQKSRLDQVLQAIDLIVERLASIEAQINSILDTLEIFANLLVAPIDTLTLFGPGNITDIQTALRGACQLETNPVKDFNDAEICAGIALHFVLGTGRSLDFLRFVFQLKDKVNQKFDNEILPQVAKTQSRADSFDARLKSEGSQLRMSWKGIDDDPSGS